MTNLGEGLSIFVRRMPCVTKGYNQPCVTFIVFVLLDVSA